MAATAPPHTLPAMTLARTPRFLRRGAWSLLTLLLILVPSLGLTPWVQTVHGTGRAIAFKPSQRPQFVASPIEGRVKKWHVVEGDRVRAGQLLVELVDNDPMILERLREQETLALQRLTLAEGRVADHESRLAFIKGEQEVLVAEAGFRIEQAEAQILVTLQELERARFDLKREELAFDRMSRLSASKVGEVVSKDQVEEAERKRDLARAQVPLVEARIKLAGKTLDGAKAQRAATEQRTSAAIQTEEAAVKSARGEQASVRQQYNTIRTQVERQANQRVYATVDGTVFRVLANAEAGGQLVRPGERLAVLVPEVKSTGEGEGLTPDPHPGIVAELFIDGNDLPLVRVGDRVLLQFEGWAAVQFAAYPEAAVGTFEGRVYLVDPTAEGQGSFRILVEPAPGEAWPDEAFLRQGVRAQGWVILGEVRLGYEVWRLLNGFPPAREVKTKEPRQPLGPVQRK
ncbi:secretion protein : Multidrug resistance efflux pump OS=Terriglobus roseus (strain DSM 18391 / NRRL B-41598 / KBS 63) GN=Terro_1166 PE=4 SV=1: Biotin_lipoyl_2: HlyD_3 [Gemmataceae bacterium]|nr:secretion protein : Multidrug resistance efflux pump OS=Terriglobus roseus (strain DSM 18391 / NRRL B-41598 / KBS 63) GN=Terro_1166 PE=4 SV=1: Biotin_lipoyl_2: HlyD_3 [Gemmataceae bacterium]VTT98648.1 secretion protein : Multidrug resistance efflux pump OS=Terriglobus roseus (strain DSM 18391 / NRRL B-41598 / KBS 63) GN=Terro_1166 PE=4 SV=1: Biotin_lipoyl_2: HlyD_3 [Gemmataceae bacterium]